MNDIGIDKKQQRYIIKKMINIAIRTTYYTFCCRNRSWDSPDLMQFWYFFCFWLLFCFVFVFALFFFLFNNPISSSICKLPIRREIYNCTFKNTNKVSTIIIVIIVIILLFKFYPSNLNLREWGCQISLPLLLMVTIKKRRAWIPIHVEHAVWFLHFNNISCL